MAKRKVPTGWDARLGPSRRDASPTPPNSPSSVGRRYHKRMSTAAVRGENQFRADTVTGRAGAGRAVPRRGFD